MPSLPTSGEISLFHIPRTAFLYEKAIITQNITFNLKECLYNALPANTPGEMMKKLRLLKGWSQFQLAQELGLTKKQGRYLIKDYETRGLYPKKDLSIKLAKLFNINAKYFYDNYYDFLEKDYVSILKTWRKNIQITQTKAAAVLGVTFETYCRWENGGSVNRKSYEKIKETLKI